MKLQLTGLRKLEQQTCQKPKLKAGFKVLKVQYCAICRTDAKMWSERHRDLVFPRVLGHEFIAEDEQENRFAVWPGSTCGECIYCKNGRENLCEEMKIMGFHHDGGFADFVQVPEESLIPLPEAMPSHLACFAEPVGCVLNAIEKLRLNGNKRIIIYGGGTLGLITALICQTEGVEPLVIEKDERKIFHTNDFLKHLGIKCLKDTTESEFDYTINACPDPIAFNLGITKLKKGGRVSFFSGLKKNETIETNLINLMHYKEIELTGSYGPTRQNMKDALPIILSYQEAFEKLIEKIILPQAAGDILQHVLSGQALRYILNYTGKEITLMKSTIETKTENSSNGSIPDANASHIKSESSNYFQTVLESIHPVLKDLLPAAQNKIDNKTKPLGSLGKLEDLSVQMSLIQNNLEPRADNKKMIIFAADHGITEEGVSAFPADVTYEMVQNFFKGGAAINVLCRHHDIDFRVVDMGVKKDFADNPILIKSKIRKGSRNFALEPAMTRDEALKAIESGMAIISKEHKENRIDLLGLGEIGIGNTTCASAIISAITGITPAESTGRGTGVDDKGLEHKIEVIEKALAFHKPDPKDGIDILCKIGGYEIAGIVGATLAAASKGIAIVLDGVISTAAGLVAYVVNPDIQGYLISGHKSVETAQRAALSHMNLDPVVDFKMGLGEGTGAAMTMYVVSSACRIMKEMATFKEAGVSTRNLK